MQKETNDMKKKVMIVLALLISMELGMGYWIKSQKAGEKNLQIMLENEKSTEVTEEKNIEVEVIDGYLVYEIEVLKNEEEKPKGNSTGGGSSGNKDKKVTPHYVDARAMLQLINDQRAKEDSNPLSWSSEIEALCKERCKELEIQFSHQRPDGSSGSSILNRIKKFKKKGENISVEFNYRNGTVSKFYSNFYNSNGHYTNMIVYDYNLIGVAIYVGSDGCAYCCMLLAKE